MDVRSFETVTRKSLRLAVLAVLAATAAVAARAEEPAAGVAASTAAAADVEDAYVYNGAARDPFLPLNGSASASDFGGGSSDREPGAFNPTGVELKGIIRMPTGRWAILTTSAGDRYVVENGKILDPRKKPVEGYVGIIKEKSLVVIGPNNQVTELKMKRDLEAEEKEKAKSSSKP